MAVGSRSNLAVDPARPVQERVREFAAGFSANGSNRDGWLRPPKSRLPTRERRGCWRERPNPLRERVYDESLDPCRSRLSVNSSAAVSPRISGWLSKTSGKQTTLCFGGNRRRPLGGRLVNIFPHSGQGTDLAQLRLVILGRTRSLPSPGFRAFERGT